jgi:hypothetical protein
MFLPSVRYTDAGGASSSAVRRMVLILTGPGAEQLRLLRRDFG